MQASKIVMVLLASSSAYQLFSTHTPHKLLKKKLDTVINKKSNLAQISVHLVCAESEKTLYSKNSNYACTPASTLKLVTAAAALDTLGPDFTYTTQLLHDGSIKHGVLKGNLYIKGSGDPSFTIDDLTHLISELKQRGIKKINGDIILDHSVFDDAMFGPGWCSYEQPAHWNSPLTGLIMNHNCIEVTIAPYGEQLVTLSPDTAFVTLDTTLSVIPPGKKFQTPFAISRVWRDKKNIILITGNIRQNTEPKQYSFTLKHPLAYLATLCKEQLAVQHIMLKGASKHGTTPSNAVVLATHHSVSLSELIIPMLKHSDNLYSDAFFKTMGATRFGSPGSWEKGSRAVLEFLKSKVHLDISKIRIFDGSGRSRYNLISVAQITALLLWLMDQPYYEAFMSALPRAGVDGSLQRRMKSPLTQDCVFAKTGTLSNISSLAGYIYPHDSSPTVFAINSYNFTEPQKEYRSLEDTICKIIATKKHPSS